MSNKQKLPKHITAHELECEFDTNANMVLANSRTGMCWAVDSGDYASVESGVEILNSGGGWPKDSDVGKQIVF